jgi:hypothetical protein
LSAIRTSYFLPQFAGVPTRQGNKSIKIINTVKEMLAFSQEADKLGCEPTPPPSHITLNTTVTPFTHNLASYSSIIILALVSALHCLKKRTRCKPTVQYHWQISIKSLTFILIHVHLQSGIIENTILLQFQNTKDYNYNNIFFHDKDGTGFVGSGLQQQGCILLGGREL